ncbi:MAG: hypothetical protein WC491_05110 [Candidatus Omnitrophota bacterium]
MERRKFKRVEINVAIKGKLVDPQKKIDISGDIPLKAKNLSEGGALLEWPRSWDCDSCSNCLGWVHNSRCKLKEDSGGEESNKDLVPEMHITLNIVPGNDIEPVKTLVKVSWVKAPVEQDPEKYDVGVSFVDDEKQEVDLKKKILVIKKSFDND